MDAFWLGLGVISTVIPASIIPESPGEDYRLTWVTLDAKKANAMLDAAVPSSRNSRRLNFAELGFRGISWNIDRSVYCHLLYDRFLFFLMERLRLEKFRICLLLLP